MTDDRAAELRARVQDVSDFPKPGILFKDITPLLSDPHCLGVAIDLLAEPWMGRGVTHVLGIESRGFIFGAAVATRIAAGFVPVRKPGKLPRAADRVSYALEYGTDAVEIHRDALPPGSRVIVVDDLIATGGTAEAAVELARRQSATVEGASFLVELEVLRGRRRLQGVEVQAVLVY